jgi:FdrA protein
MAPDAVGSTSPHPDTQSHCLVLASTYRDSILLMDLSHWLESLPGVLQVAVMMATPHNKSLLKEAGLLNPQGDHAGTNDLLVCIRASTATVAAEACRAAVEHLNRQQPRTALEVGKVAPRTLEMALRHMPEANLACISVPGPYAAYEARKAVRHGLHVFLFSDHVDLPAEVSLKRFAAQQGVLVMGPDCGTAIVNGVPLGFANQLPRGPVGIIAASGTGLQQVSCLLARQGIGISQGLGVGGRDATQAVGGYSLRAALQALAQDQATRVIVLVAKPPAAAVTARLLEDAKHLGKPCVLAFVGTPIRYSAAAPVYTAQTLAEAAAMAAALGRGETLPVAIPQVPGPLRQQLNAARSTLQPTQTALRGLYCGGTLAQEALWLLRGVLAEVVSNLDHTWSDTRMTGHTVLDLGAETFTDGRPHPMIDPGVRRQHLLALARQPDVAVVLCDVMLGWGAHPDPAGALASAWQEARHIAQGAGRELVGVATVCGTPDDPQGFAGQCHLLQEHGFLLADSNAQAVRLAAAIIGIPVPPAVPLEASPWDDTTTTAAASLPPAVLPARLPELFTTGPRVINLGLEHFTLPLIAHGVPVVQVDWRPPAGGDIRLMNLLERLV